MTAIASLLLASLALQNSQDQQVPPIQDTGTSWVLNFPKAATNKPEMGMSLAWFVSVCENATGTNFTFSDETATALESRKIRLLGPKVVPKEDFYSFFQMMMIINDFVCAKVGPDHLSVVVISSLKGQERTGVRNDALHVSPDELDLYADQPATMITTVVHLPNTDVRQLSNSMRTMFPDPNTGQLLPAGSTNSMIVSGFGSNVVAMVKMLKLIDEASQIEAVLPEFAVIPLEFISAIEVQGLVEELLDASVRAATSRGQQVQQAQGATGVSTRGRTETKIMVDERTNSLLVMAMPEDMPRIKELIAELDVNVVERDRNYHIFSLQNVEAEALAETLNEFLEDATRMEQEQSAGGAVPGGQGAGGTRGGSRRSTEFVVVPDNESNSLLIAANATRYAELASLINRLDKRQDQVLIETALIELSGSDFLDIGVELGLADIPGTDSTGGFGLTSFGLSTLQDTDGDGVPDIKVPNSSSGITAGILDGDDFSLPVLINLLQERRKADVLNVPSVLVNNNGFAKVETKDYQPTTQITTNGGVSGQTQENFNEYVDAGITMEISPSISARNYLRLDIFLTVSTFLGAVQGAIPPPKTERTIETVVNVPDGDTMVIGGIVVDNNQQTHRQVPLLGDIPIIGRLFGRDSETQNRTALYFFVTPHIMRDEEFADLAQYSYQKKLEAADIIGADRIRQVDPRFGAEQNPIDLRGFDVPLYSSPPRGAVEPEDVGLESQIELNELVEGDQD